MNDNYDEALKLMLLHEGGYSNHPADPGGPTNFGITLADYRRYINKAATALDVRNMKIEDAKKIYRAQYWDAQKCDELPPGVDYAIFDYGVNSGVGRSGKVLRRILDLDDKTYSITPGVLAVSRAKDPDDLIDRICDERLAFLKRLKTWPTFGAGWGRRVHECRSAAHAMVRKAKVKPAKEPEKPAPGKATVEATPWWHKIKSWVVGSGLLGTMTLGGVTVNADLVYAFCAFIGVLFVTFLAFVYLVPPRGRIRKGL